MDNNYYSNQEDIYSYSRGKHSKHSAGKNKKHKSKKNNGSKFKRRRAVVIVSLVLAIVICAGVGVRMYMDSILNTANRDTDFNSDNVQANSEVFKGKDYTNIALFGVDARENTFKGCRSDSVIVLTIDKKHNKIKMTSLARDSYVKMDGHGKDKLTHAYAYGGAELAVKTINQNYNLDIQDYVTVNFFGFAEIINYLGGVTLDVDASEMDVMNTHYISYINSYGIKCDYIKKTGVQLLNGGQALAYTRNRYSPGGDIERGNRQKEVLTLVFEKVKKLGITKLPELAKIGLKNCQTSLTNSEIIDIGTWALMNSPTVENKSLPDEDCHPKSGSGAMINGVWYYIYDLDVATQKLHDFINEEGTYVDPNASSSVSTAE